MADSLITDRFAIYNDDCMNVMRSLPDGRVHFSVYSPPFAGLYHYSSDERDLSNCQDRDEFFRHYRFIVREIHRITMPGRCSAVHVTDIPASNTGCDHLFDLAGETIRLHESEGWHFVARHAIWKEPLAFRNRTLTKNLAHMTIVEDSALCGVASADYLLVFRRTGENPVPVAHPTGLDSYAGESRVPHELARFRNWKGKQTENRWSHWIWRQYASSVWDDIRLERVLPFRDSRDENDEKHVHPLQLDVIERAVVLRSNPGEIVFTPFMGVGSEVYGAVINGRIGMGAELKPSYFKQAVANMEASASVVSQDSNQVELFSA